MEVFSIFGFDKTNPPSLNIYLCFHIWYKVAGTTRGTHRFIELSSQPKFIPVNPWDSSCGRISPVDVSISCGTFLPKSKFFVAKFNYLVFFTESIINFAVTSKILHFHVGYCKFFSDFVGVILLMWEGWQVCSGVHIFFLFIFFKFLWFVLYICVNWVPDVVFFHRFFTCVHLK